MQAMLGIIVALFAPEAGTDLSPALFKDEGAEKLEAAKACAALEKKKRRLACYDALFGMAAKPQIAAKNSRPAVNEDKPADTGYQDQSAAINPVKGDSQKTAQRIQAFGAPARLDKQRLEEISDVVRSVTLSKKTKRARIRLENDQIWDSKEEIPSRLLKAGKTVIIKRGSLGGFRIVFDGSKRAFGVKRYVKK